jgi:hypothetical protein
MVSAYQTATSGVPPATNLVRTSAVGWRRMFGVLEELLQPGEADRKSEGTITRRTITVRAITGRTITEEDDHEEDDHEEDARQHVGRRRCSRLGSFPRRAGRP